MNSVQTAALAYHEPGIATILTLASFLLLLNAVNYVLDRVVYCGLIGQILIGVGWGLPGTDWLSRPIQETVMQLGYLGLILIVYEGGLSIEIKTLKANLSISAVVALIGISAPIGLSFVLQTLLDANSLQAFAAGAALCSTSLGTTFTVLTTSGLTQSRLGVVLTSAAMIDDVVGLIMVQVISNLGTSSSLDAATIIRPIGVSIAFAVIVPLICVFVIKPIARLTSETQGKLIRSVFLDSKQSRHIVFAFNTLILIGFVAASSYAGTSNLFAAYLAGASTTWFDDLLQTLLGPSNMPEGPTDRTHESNGKPSSVAAFPKCEGSDTRTGSRSGKTAEPSADNDLSKNSQSEAEQPSNERAAERIAEISGRANFDQYYSALLSTILKPFFFASIGFSIPITRMFSGEVVWRGFVYAALMVLGKLLCGLCLVRFHSPSVTVQPLLRQRSWNLSKCWPFRLPGGVNTNHVARPLTTSSAQPSTPQETRPNPNPQPPSKSKHTRLPKPRSLYPAAILGSAMVARGEIGFLVSSIAESNGIFSAGSEETGSQLFLVVTWAILICTILGPVTVGLLVRRVKRLQEVERRQKSGKEDPLGIWGIVGTS